MALAYHKEKNGSSVTLPINNKRLDIAAYPYPYDYGKSDIHEDKFWEDREGWAILLRQSVDEHDWKHRVSCFKKVQSVDFTLERGVVHSQMCV